MSKWAKVAAVSAGVSLVTSWFMVNLSAWVAAQQEYDRSMNRLMDSIPAGRYADFRSPGEIARNPSPRSWRM